jgi:hypothetical protein
VALFPCGSYRSSFYHAVFEIAGSAAITTVEEALEVSAGLDAITCVHHVLLLRYPWACVLGEQTLST